ncbi:MAG TPA: dihydrolipoamide acetyltransferase family protein [Nocardioides sp.]|uniref:dihydrolipoamide acetyltransferase family protein n=1 Tax=Nocardioides sp. TaxID=35761 RepID=UPI002E337A05|nr:dihydrolipoamide acetyltransferase family protein [Nocardioides sp.]HEX3931044.1 dihydrolipoamide acetyltransferase family protein [Nocardioides sp.]
MPGVAANATQAVLAEWLVAESADFEALEPVATVETDKAAVEVEAEGAGRLLKTLVPAGAMVEVGDPIAVLGDPGEQVDDLVGLLTSLGVRIAADVTLAVRRDVVVGDQAATAAATADVPAAEQRAPVASRVFASPLARKLAKQGGLAVEQIPGSGPRGRVLRRDVEEALTRRRTSAASQSAQAPSRQVAGAAYEEVPHSRIRRAIAARLVESVQTAPHFYLRATVRADRLVILRAELNEEPGTTVSINDLVVRAAAVAHQRVPGMNVTWSPDVVRRYASVDIAVAVATEQGLMTPVVRDAASLTVRAIADRIRDLAGRARAGSLKQTELEGGSLCVTNLGSYGVEEFAAIINPPQAAILAVGAVREEPVVADGTVVAARVMRVTLSVDHRPVDGVLAAEWLATLVELLESPVRLLG